MSKVSDFTDADGWIIETALTRRPARPAPS
jgi:hypothetical protein